MKERLKLVKMQLIPLLLAIGMVCLAGCNAAQKQTDTSAGDAATETTAAEPGAQAADDVPATDQSTAALDAVPETVGGFTLKSQEFSRQLNAQLLTYAHEGSGAELVCIKNDDPELAFGIFYHTPMVDETDTNHIFEHAIISGSEKYPSKDIFFDIVNKSYNTNINAFTYDTFTGYPLASQSQEQLQKLADVYLSCMVKPDILTNENIFKREALRYQLYDKSEPLTLSGTVFSEDFGGLTDTYRESYRNVRRALYPDSYTANAIGYLHRNYQDLTYEKAIATYERCYHFDNSVIMLYGDIDYVPFMEFIDSEYLANAKPAGVDLTAYEDKNIPTGHEVQTVPSPAYLGDADEDVSQINYAVDLSNASWEDIVGYEFFSSLLSSPTGPLVKRLEDAGIYQDVLIESDYYSANPYFLASLFNGNEDQAQVFEDCLQDTFKEVAENGFDKELNDTMLKSLETASYLTRDNSDVGFTVFPLVANYWTHTGKTDFHVLYESVLAELEKDTDQTIFKKLANNLLTPTRSALVSTVPTPGLAEEYEDAMGEYLAEMKSSMTDEELDALIADTIAFDTWNESEFHNNDFMIDPADLPDVEAFTAYETEDKDGITTYIAPVDIEEVGRYTLYFDSSEIPKEDLPFLALYQELVGQMDTENYSKDELIKKSTNLIYSSRFNALYPSQAAGDNHHPMVCLTWTGRTEDYAESLNLLLETMEHTKFDNVEQMLVALSGSIDSYDVSRSDNFTSLARNLAAGVSVEDFQYFTALYGQDTYYALEEILGNLESNPESVNDVAAKLEEIGTLLLQRGSLIFTAVAKEDAVKEIASTTRESLKDLPENTSHQLLLALDTAPATSAYIVESPNQDSVMIGNTNLTPGMDGRYISFYNAVSDRYFIPNIRFQMGAYSGGGSINPQSGLLMAYSTSDPNVGKTLDVFRSFPEYLETAEISAEDLDGYILSAFGIANTPYGILTEPTGYMEAIISGEDLEAIAKLTNEIKDATPADQAAAVEYYKKLINDASFATVGNVNAIQAEADVFDQVVDYRE